MKKLSSHIYRLLIVTGIFIFGFLVSDSVSASLVPIPFQITFPSDTTTNDRIINDDSALIGGYFITDDGATGAVSVDVHIGSSPQSMNISSSAVFSNPGIQQNTSYPFTLSFGGLTPGTTYYFYATETISGESFPVQNFTTTGVPPSTNLPPPSSNSTLSGAFNISFPSADQVITETSVTLSGTIVALARVSVNLGISYGTSPSLMTQTGAVYSNPSLASGAEDTFTYTMSNLTPGTGYYFQFRDLTRNTNSELLYVKTKGGNGIGGSAQYGAQVITDGASTPTSFDSGVIVEDPFEETGIVPCATSTNTAMCGFQDFLKLIANIIDYTLILLVPATAAVCVYAGVSFIVSRGDPAKLKVAKDRLVRVLIAMAVIMLAWAVVAGIYKSLIPEDQLDKYILLDVLNTGGN